MLALRRSILALGRLRGVWRRGGVRRLRRSRLVLLDGLLLWRHLRRLRLVRGLLGLPILLGRGLLRLDRLLVCRLRAVLLLGRLLTRLSVLLDRRLLRLVNRLLGLRRDGLHRLGLVGGLWLGLLLPVLLCHRLRLLHRLLVLLAFVAVPLRVLLDEVHLAAALRTRAHGRTSHTIAHYG